MSSIRYLIIIALMSHQYSSTRMGVQLYVFDVEIDEQLSHPAEGKDEMLLKTVIAYNGVFYHYLGELEYNCTEAFKLISRLFSLSRPKFLQNYRHNNCTEHLLRIYKWSKKEYNYFNSFVMNTVKLVDAISVLLKQRTNPLVHG